MLVGDRLHELLSHTSGLQGGQEADFDYTLDKVLLRSGDAIHVAPEGVTAFVGGNNVGKSTLLREVAGLIAESPWKPRQLTLVVDDIQATKTGELRDAVAWLAAHAELRVPPGSNVATFVGLNGIGSGLDIGTQVSSWSATHKATAGLLGDFLTFFADAGNRVGMVGDIEMREHSTDPPQHPLHILEDNHELMDRLSDISMEVFGKRLFLDRLGRRRSLRVGEVSVAPPPVDRITDEYRLAVQALPLLSEQGDGMRSLLGLLIPVLTASYRIVVIDEPEAFLHPPQARALGVQLGRLASRQHVQVLLATHDSSLLSGLVDSGAPVSVTRLTRDVENTTASQLPPAGLEELWTDPVLRYTRALEGLFHSLVVLAEGEVDCGLLAAGLDCTARKSDPNLPATDILFLPTGGKGGMAKVARVLRAVAVRVVAAPDLDVLQNESELVSLVKALDGRWEERMGQTWKIATSDLQAPKEILKVEQVIAGVGRALEGHHSEPYTAELREAVRAQLRIAESPWKGVQEHGLSAFKGDAYKSVEELLVALSAVGIVPVYEGVLERMVPSVSVRKGPRWLRVTLEQNLQCSRTVQEHLDRILAAGREA